MAVSEINEKHLIPGAYITLVLKDSFNGRDPENSGAAQAIFSTVSLLQSDGAQLSSKDDYGHFFRTIPTELMFGRVMMDFVADRGWKTIAVFYTGDALGSEMMDSIELQAKKRNISVGYRRAFWEMGTSSDVGPALDALKESGQQIVLVAAVGIPQVRLLLEAVRRGLITKDYAWLTINQVTEPLLEMDGSPLKPMDLNGLFMFDNMLRLRGYPPYENFLNRWAVLDPAEYPYAGERDISSNEAQAYSCMMVMASGFASAVKGNWTALRLLGAGRLGYKLKPLNMNTNYTGPGGPMVFDEAGDVVYGNFILYNFQNGRVVEIGTSYSGVFNLSSPPMYFDGTHNTPSDTAPLQVLNPSFVSSIGIVIICTAGLGILFCLITMSIVVFYRKAQIIKASSRFVCFARPFTLNVGFILVVSNIVAKNFRVYRIFHNIYVTKRVIKDSHLLKIVSTILVINLAIMAIWFIKTPPTLQQITMEDFTTYWDCNSQTGESAPFFVLLFVYNVALLLLATYLGYKNRNVAANYNECRQIAFVVYNILLSGCIAMPTVFLPADQYLTKFFLSNVVLLFGTTVSLMFMFLPKIYKLFSQIERRIQDSRVECSGNGEEGSFDNLFNNRASWLNGASSTAGSTVGRYLPGGRKGSAASLEDSKGSTLKESHIGYMGVKFQNRYMPFLASWCMRRVLLFPADKYFTAFESGRPEDGQTFTYGNVFIHSKEPGNYILKVTGYGRYNFLLQVRDEERLMHWYSLFENKPGHSFTSTVGGGAGGMTTLTPLDSLPISFSQSRSESDQTLRVIRLDSCDGYDSSRSRQGNKSGSVLREGSGDIGGYFDRGGHISGRPISQPYGSYGLFSNTPQQHRHTSSAYSMATFTASPRTSLNEVETERPSSRTMQPPSRQTTLGVPEGEVNSLMTNEINSSRSSHLDISMDLVQKDFVIEKTE
ncbi:hypothetical protein EDD11_006544 [Mortierella claussenii]|nr:hypothetical protein EDD11_006544 [Mortierella claussenii]